MTAESRYLLPNPRQGDPPSRRQATRDNKQSRGNPVAPSHNPIKAQAKDVSGSYSDSRSDVGYAISVNPVDVLPVVLVQ